MGLINSHQRLHVQSCSSAVTRWTGFPLVASAEIQRAATPFIVAVDEYWNPLEAGQRWRSKYQGESVISNVVVLGERIGQVILIAQEPLWLFFEFMFNHSHCMCPRCFNFCCCLLRALFFLHEVHFHLPPQWGWAVRHGEEAGQFGELALDYTDPRADNCCNEIQEVQGHTELEFFWYIELPCLTTVGIAAEDKRVDVSLVGMRWMPVYRNIHHM